MQNLIIFNQNTTTAEAYGIGKFIKIFREGFDNIHFRIYQIDLHCNCKELSIVNFSDITKIAVPFSNASGIIALLSLYIDNIENSVLFLNYTIQFELAKFFKEKHPSIKTVGIVHVFRWLWMVGGNERVLTKYLMSSSFNSEATENLRKTVKEEIDNMQYLDKTVALSSDSFNVLNKIYEIDKDRLSTIPNGINDSYKQNIQKTELREELSVDSNEKIVLYVGRLDRLKGISALVLAFNRLVVNIENCRLVFVGDGDFSAISKTLGKAAAKITFTGRISQKELKKWYAIADVGVLPSLSEECSFVGIEMLMHGLPIVATNARGVRNMFHNMENSLTVNCRGRKSVFERELYEAMLRLLTDKELADDLRKKARRWYLDNYQFKFVKQRYQALIKELTQNNKIV